MTQDEEVLVELRRRCPGVHWWAEPSRPLGNTLFCAADRATVWRSPPVPWAEQRDPVLCALEVLRLAFPEGAR